MNVGYSLLVMKKTLALIVILASILLIASCQPPATVPAQTSSESAPAEAASTSAPADVQEPASDLYASIPAEIPGEVIYIPFPVEITVDGDLADWEGLPSSFVDYGPNPSPNPAENGSFTFAVAADMDKSVFHHGDA